MLNQQSSSRILLVITALLFSTGGAAIKFANISGWQLASYRSGIAAILLFAFLPGTRRGYNLRVGGAALCYAGTLVSYVLANRLTTAANTIYLQSISPVYVVLLSPILLREKATRKDYYFTGLTLCGLLLVFAGADPPSRTAPDPFRGNLLALASGLFWALALIAMRFLGRSREDADSAYAVAFGGNLLAFLICLAPAVAQPAPHLADWVTVVYLGAFNIGLSYICLTHGIRRVTAVETSTILLLEPALNPLWTWLLAGERPSRLALLGGIVIMSATAFRILFGSRAQKEAF